MKNKFSLIVTGAAGFIGFSLIKKFLNNDISVVGIDNSNYYDLSLKARLKILKDIALQKKVKFSFYKCSLENKKELKDVFDLEEPSIVVNLAAQAGVRYSIENPDAYFSSNLLGFGSILDLSRKFKIKNFIFASSSSVYGGNKEVPFKETHKVDKPLSLYAATKKSNEIIAHSYSHLYKLPITGLRFFTVYGPWGRPDMAPMIFLKSYYLIKILKFLIMEI